MTAYQIWEAEANKLMLVKHGVGIDDIPDMDWYGWFDGGWTPREAVNAAIKIVNAGDWI